jgi:predicted RNA-binding Zn-ribbon protein involved in translation (DUF1610 family)
VRRRIAVPRVDRYRQNAQKCFALAQKFKDPDARRSLFAMADAWVMLATQRVKHVENPASDPRAIPCPHCRSPMLWYSADLIDDSGLRHSYQCEKCGFVSQSDDQPNEMIRSVKRS